MHRQGRSELGGQHRQADVLHDHRIHAGGLGRQQQFGGLLQLVAEHQHVHREKALNAAAVQPGHHLRQIGYTEVFGPQTGIEAIDAEIDRIGTIGHRSP